MSGSNGVAMECAPRSGIEVYFRSGVGVATECDTGVALECVANMQINTPKTLRSGIGVFCESGK